MATRVFELARELGVTSKIVLTKCRAEGLEIKNHMSTLSAGLEATIREWFSEEAVGTAIETTEHVDLSAARKQASKVRRRKKVEPEPEAQPEAGAETPAEVAPTDEQAAPLTEEPTAELTEAVEAIAAEAEVEVEAQEAAEVEVGVEAEQELEPAEAEPHAQEGDAEAEPEAEAKAEGVKPAGPQVVPAPARMKGPRVVRVEKPDYIQRPVRSPRGPRPGGPGGPGGRRRAPGYAPGDLLKEREAANQPVLPGDAKPGAASKRRSPRRTAGRSGASGGQTQGQGKGQGGAKKWKSQDLAERSQRLAAATGGGLRRRRASVSRKFSSQGSSIKSGKVEIEEPMTIKSLSGATGIKSAEIIKKLMGMGLFATVNQGIEREMAETICVDYEIELVVAVSKTAEEELLDQIADRPVGDLTPRAPVVTFLGHVDHGKTSLLDKIRNTGVAKGEAGGITQHIGASRYDKGDSHVVFLDTPGHEAFTAMRARGANMTDVVVLVVAADDGVMPQTIEAISHAKASGVPIVVALNKVDIPNANVTRAMGQLAEHDLQPRQWGGDTEVIETSAMTGLGVEDLIELLSLEAELLELKAEDDAPATGFVIESQMKPGLGPVATLLVRNGTLKVGDVVLAGRSHARIRRMTDYNGKSIKKAGPSTPVEISGLDEVAEAGDKFFVLDDLDRARSIAQERRTAVRAKALAATPAKSLEDLLGQIKAGETSQLAIILKADVQGSIEAIVGVLEKLGNEDVKVNVIHTAVGGITTGDVTLAEASNAIIIGFNVIADSTARHLAEAKKVDIRTYSVIYDIADDIKAALEKGLAPEIREESVGRAEIRQTFKVSRVGTIAGCFVTEGNAARNAKVRIIRNNIVIENERSLESLKRFKDDAKEVRSGMECGLKIASYDDIKEGDILEFYRQVEIARTL